MSPNSPFYSTDGGCLEKSVNRASGHVFAERSGMPALSLGEGCGGTCAFVCQSYHSLTVRGDRKTPSV